MRIESNGKNIICVDDWKRFAPPKSHKHWKKGRSAYELAKAWCGEEGPAMPMVIRAHLDSRQETRDLTIEKVFPELKISFDRNGGEPRNADLAFVGNNASHKAAGTIEAKADEAFGLTIAKTLADAIERKLTNPHSRGIQRVEELVQSLFRRRLKGHPHVADLRYQLLTAAAGTLAYAVKESVSIAVLILHEFVTEETNDDNLARNDRDYRDFVYRLGGTSASNRIRQPF
jgi:hypothetical protein